MNIKHFNQDLIKLSQGEHSLKEVLKMAGFEEEKPQCRDCKKIFTPDFEKESIKLSGSCLGCEDLRADVMAEELE